VVGRRARTPRTRLPVTVVMVLVGATALGACGSSGKRSSSASVTTAKGASGAPAVGVTPTEIKLGVALVDFGCIKNFTDEYREHQDEVYRAYIDDVNAKGGVAGRKLVPVFETYCPIGSAPALAACTKLTEDEKVFAVIGSFVDFSGDAQQCVTKQHHTPLMTFNLSEKTIDAAPPGFIVFPGVTNERAARVLVQLLGEEHTLKGKKVAVLGGTNEADGVNNTIVPRLKKLGVPLGTTAILSVGSSSDTTAAQAQLDSFIERWKGEGVDAVFLSGDSVASIGFVTKLRQAMPKVLLMVDTQDAGSFGQELTHQGVTPNPYEGILTPLGPTSPVYDKSANWAYCRDIYQKQTGKRAPDASVVVKGPGGKTVDTYGTITDACQLVTMFHDIGARVGKNLNADTWAAAVNDYGKITNRGSGPYNSLHRGKYDTNDSFELAAFDSSIPPQGAWRAVTPLRDITGAR
jgi:ABC-type branched-subunit amino acid transport system substrate-binding protein